MPAYAAPSAVASPTSETPPELRFCPFCRDCFEGLERCPDHDLVLVDWEALPRGPDEPGVADDDVLTPVDPRFGRAELGLGALLLLAGFVAPLFTVTSADVMSEPRTFSALAAAADQAPNLWTLPFVGAIVLSLVLRRRRPAQMRGARLAILLLSLAVPASLAYTLSKVYAGAAQLTAARSYAFDVAIEWGIALPLVATALLVVGAVRFGRIPIHASGAPASAEPEGASAPPPAPPPGTRRRRRR